MELKREDFKADQIFTLSEFRKNKGIRPDYNNASLNYRINQGDLDFVRIGSQRCIVNNKKAAEFEVDKETRIARKERTKKNTKTVKS